jgi:hypothetical protein
MRPSTPTGQPTQQPTGPTPIPTRRPSRHPTSQPSSQPSSQPTSTPTSPTSQPTSQPSFDSKYTPVVNDQYGFKNFSYSCHPIHLHSTPNGTRCYYQPCMRFMRAFQWQCNRTKGHSLSQYSSVSSTDSA